MLINSLTSPSQDRKRMQKLIILSTLSLCLLCLVAADDGWVLANIFVKYLNIYNISSYGKGGGSGSGSACIVKGSYCSW